MTPDYEYNHKQDKVPGHQNCYLSKSMSMCANRVLYVGI